MSSVIESMPAAGEPDADHALMIGVRDGDVARLGVLFERHHVSLYRFFVRLTGDRFASEDLVQLVFFRILRFRHTYRDDGHFRVWMYRIARTTLASYWQRPATAPVRQDSPDVEALCDDSPHAADSAMRRDEMRLLYDALDSLRADDREVVVLARIRELHYDDIAQLLNISVGAVKVRVHRAMKLLRRAYLKLGGNKPSAMDATGGCSQQG